MPTATTSPKRGRPRRAQLSTFLAALTGSEVAEAALLVIAVNEEGYASQISELTGYPSSAINKQLRRFEEANILVRRNIGRVAMYSFNNRGNAVRYLKDLVESLADPALRERFSARKRPRATTKVLKYLEPE